MVGTAGVRIAGCAVIACGEGLDAQPDGLEQLFQRALAELGETELVGLTVNRLRPGRWVGCAQVANESLARALVRLLRQEGHSAVLGPPDKEHLPAFRHRNQPVLVRPGLSICFPWAASETELALEIDPGGAFGVGSHPSTILAARALLEALEKNSQLDGPPKVLDVGCGSGVLALLAAFWHRAGQPRAGKDVASAPKIIAQGTDISTTAAACARRNARLNGLEHLTTFSAIPLEKVRDTFEVIAANIGADVLNQLAPELAERLAPGGQLVLSGISKAQTSRLAARFRNLGVELQPSGQLDDWCSLVS